MLSAPISFFSLLVVFTVHSWSSQVRQQAMNLIKRMYEKDALHQYIEKFALNYLQLLAHPNPPSVLFGADKDTGGILCVVQSCRRFW